MSSSDQSGNLNVESLSVNNNIVAYDNSHTNDNIKYHNTTKCVHQNDNTNTTLRSEHMSTCRLCARNIFCSNLSSSVVNSGEYDINGKIVIDKSRNMIGKTLTLGNNNDVTLSSNNDGDLLINDVKLFQSYVPQTLNQIDETQFCQNWKIPYVGKGLITGYVTSVSDNGKYQTIIDSAGNISVSSDNGYTFSTPNNVTSGSSLGSLAMSENGQYQLTCDFAGNVYQSSNYGATWQSKVVFTIYDVIFLDYVTVSVSQSGKFQAICVEGKSYVSDNFGLSFKQLTKLSDSEIFKKVIAKESVYFDFTFSDSSGNIIASDDQIGMFIALTYDLSGNHIYDNNVQITSVNESGQWLNDGVKNWMKTGGITGTPNTIAVSNDLKYVSVVDLSGNIYRSDTSGGLINNSFYEDTRGLYHWSSNIVQNLGLKSISDISMDSSGLYQTVITEDGWIFSSHNTNIDSSGNWQETSGNWISTRIPINDQSLLFLNVSSDGSTQYTIDETGRIFRSDDYGVSWLGGTVNTNFSGIACSESGQYATIIDSSGYIITTSSYGTIWGAPQKITPFDPDQGLVKITLSSSGKYQYAISKYNVYRSLDYGKSWSIVTNIEASINVADFSTTIGDPIVLFAPLTNIAISGDGSVLVLTDSSYGNSGGTKYSSYDQYIYVCSNVLNTNIISKSLNTYTIYSTEIGGVVSGLALSETGQYISVSDSNQNIIFSNTYGQTWEMNDQFNGITSTTQVAMSKSGKINCFLYNTESNSNIATFTNNISPSNIVDPSGNLGQYNGIYGNSQLGIVGQCSALAISNDATYKVASLSNDSGQVFLSHIQPSESLLVPWELVLETDHDINGTAMSGNGKYIYIIDQGGNIYISDTYGSTFSSSATVTKHDLYDKKTFLALDMSADGHVQSALDFSGNIYVSTDTGNTWNDPINVSNLIDDAYLPVKIKLSATGEIQYVIIVASESTSSLIYSHDFGKTWEILFSSQDDAFYSLATSSSGQHITIGGLFGNVYVSHNYGVTFNKVKIHSREYYQPIIDISMSASGEYQSLVTFFEYSLDGNALTYVSSNYGTKWKPIDNEIEGFTIGAAISMSDSGQYQSYVGFDMNLGISYIATSSTFGQSFNTINMLPYFNDLTESEIVNFPVSIAVSGSGKYQAIMSLTYNSSLVFLYKSTDYGKTWNISETIPIVTLTRTMFGDYFGDYFFQNFIYFLIFTRFKISADGQYTAIALNNSIYLSHSPLVFDNTTIDTLEVTNNAVINTLNVNALNVNGGFVAKTKVVSYNYNIDLSDYIICCDTSGCILRLPNDAPIGQIFIITNVVSNLIYHLYPPYNGLFQGSNSNTSFGNNGIDAITILCIGNDTWINLSRPIIVG